MSEMEARIIKPGHGSYLITGTYEQVTSQIQREGLGSRVVSIESKRPNYNYSSDPNERGHG